MNDEHEDDELEGEEEFEIYAVDDETRLLIETACNCIVALSEAQLLEESKQGLLSIADALASRFAIQALEVEEEIHSTDEGEEIIYKPKGGIFQDRDDGDSLAPSP
jgi:hypothetical protein